MIAFMRALATSDYRLFLVLGVLIAAIALVSGLPALAVLREERQRARQKQP